MGLPVCLTLQCVPLFLLSTMWYHSRCIGKLVSKHLRVIEDQSFFKKWIMFSKNVEKQPDRKICSSSDYFDIFVPCIIARIISRMATPFSLQQNWIFSLLSRVPFIFVNYSLHIIESCDHFPSFLHSELIHKVLNGDMTVTFSHLNMWGKRLDKVVPISDVQVNKKPQKVQFVFMSKF